MAFVTQVTENLDTSIILKVRELITLLTGRPPRNAAHIEELKYMIENFPHPNLGGVVYLQNHQNRSGTVPMDSDIWGKLADWRFLTQAQQKETKEFLLMKFSIEDLQLAWDQYIIQNGGRVPTTSQYRIFINNWRAQMKMVLEQKEDEIDQERHNNSVLHSQTGFLTHINDGQLQDLQNLEQGFQNLEQENETQLRDLQNLEHDNQNLEQENETQKAIIEKQNERLRKYKIDDKYLRKQLAEKDRINQELHDQLKDVNMLCNKLKKEIKTILQKK